MKPLFPWKCNSVLFSIVQVQNILYCLHFLSCHNSIIPFGLKILIIWRFYITVNRIVEAYSAFCVVWTESLCTRWAMSAVYWVLKILPLKSHSIIFSASLHHVTVNNPFMMIFGHQQQSYLRSFSCKVPSILILF